MAKTKSTKAEAVTETAPAPVVQSMDSGSITVALNQPQGIVFRLFKDGSEYKRVHIEGNAAHLAGAFTASPLPRGGYGLTTIAADDWQEIKKQYGELPIFKNGLIFAASSVQNASAQAKEQAEIKSGFEPVDDRSTLTAPNKE